MSADLTVIWWRDIPAQVTAKSGRQVVRAELETRFQTAIDRAAMVAGLSGTDEYLSHWRRTSRPCTDDLAHEVESEIARLETGYPSKVLGRLVDSGGLADGEGASDD